MFLGRYVPSADTLPHFLVEPAPTHRFELHERTLERMDSFGDFDLVDLSNVMDWMSVAEARCLAARVGAELRPGAAVLWRQLNNATERRDWFGDAVVFDENHDAQLTALDRSLFYESIHVGTKR